MSKISEFMNINVVIVHPDDTLEKVVRLFKDKNINGLPVTNTDNKVIGIISARDLLAYSEKTKIIPLPYSADWMYSYVYLLDNITYKKSVEEFLKTSVADVMKKRVTTIHEHNSWHEAAFLMKEKEVNRLPVVDEDGNLKGIIARTDLLNFLAEHEAIF